MERTTSWIKKQIQFLISSIWQIIQGGVLFLLVFSGYGIALLLRIRGYNGYIISLVGICVEVIALVFCYFLFKSYLKTEDLEIPQPKKKGDY